MQERTKGSAIRALVAMSGGVDSSVAALMMVRKGFDCIGVTMKLYDSPDPVCEDARVCCSLDDVEDARAVAFRLGMRYYVYNFREDFSEKVIDPFVQAYLSGDTPNPCIECNRSMKFSLLYEKARILSCDKIATGHYARSVYDEESGRWLLKRSANPAKDQSYVLYFLSQEQLSHIVFPLGEFSDKDQVRLLAGENGFENAKKHDSQDICFVPDGDYGSFIERRLGRALPPGDFVDESGMVLGRHRNQVRYTIGQRRGLGLSLKAPLYVKRKDVEKNQVILSPESELFSRRLVAEKFNWISMEAPGGEIRVTAKPRYRAREAEAVARVLPGGKVEVLFDTAQRAITTGQAVVLYDGEVVVGGGTITQAEG